MKGGLREGGPGGDGQGQSLGDVSRCLLGAFERAGEEGADVQPGRGVQKLVLRAPRGEGRGLLMAQFTEACVPVPARIELPQ